MVILGRTLVVVGLAVATASGQRGPARELRAAVPAVLEDAAARDRALAAVAGCRDEDPGVAVDALIEAYEQLERTAEPESSKRLRILRAGGGSNRLGRSRHRIQRVHDVQDRILAELRGSRDPAAVAAMAQQLLRATSATPLTLRLLLADRAVELPDAQLAQLTERSPGGDDGAVVLLAAVAALGPRAERVGDWVVRQLRHDNVDVRMQAARTLARLARPDGIVPLVERLDQETGAGREAVLDALVVLTGVHPGESAASWRAWLAAEGTRYVAGEVELGRGDAAQRQKRRDQGTTSGTYFGIPQDGESILYVVDRSQSMRSLAPGRTRAGGGRGDADDPDSRWRVCLQELRQALGRLRPEQRFNVVAFADQVSTFDGKMVPATTRNTERALTWLEDLGLEFQTNVYDALDLSFVLAGRGARDRYYPAEVDTVFFLSDGEPTRPEEDGRFPRGGSWRDDPAQILSAVRRWNVLARVRVHAIGIGLGRDGRPGRGRRGGGAGGGGARRFLQQLAEQNGGRFVSLD